jgi:hypothetical protein
MLRDEHLEIQLDRGSEYIYIYKTNLFYYYVLIIILTLQQRAPLTLKIHIACRIMRITYNRQGRMEFRRNPAT